MNFAPIWQVDIKRASVFFVGGKLKKFINLARSPGIQVVTVFRFGQWSRLQNKLIKIITEPVYFITRELVTMMWGVELPREAEIGAGFFIAHFGGIIISPDAKIGNNFTISQGVTIGVSGQGEKRGVPVISDNVYVASGAKLFGKISIGKNVKIGPNSVVHKSIPDNAVVVLYPGFKILSYQEDPDQADAFEATE